MTTTPQEGSVVKPGDAIWARLVVDPLAIPVARWLARRSWVTPNRITAVAALIGVASAATYAAGLLRLGGILFLLRFYADCLDGKVSRLQGSSSATGAMFDLAADVGTIGLNLAALSWYLFRQGALPLEVILALLTGALFYNGLLQYRKQLAAGLGLGGGGYDGSWEPNIPVLRAWVRFSRRKNMTPVPWALEMEVLALGLLPMFTADDLIVSWGVGAMAAFYWLANAVNLRRAIRLGRMRDSASRKQ